MLNDLSSLNDVDLLNEFTVLTDFAALIDATVLADFTSQVECECDVARTFSALKELAFSTLADLIMLSDVDLLSELTS